MLNPLIKTYRSSKCPTYTHPAFVSTKSLFYNRFCNCVSLGMPEGPNGTFSATLNNLSIHVTVRCTACKFLLGDSIFPFSYQTVPRV